MRHAAAINTSSRPLVNRAEGSAAVRARAAGLGGCTALYYGVVFLEQYIEDN
jgi:hypothetical protein